MSRLDVGVLLSALGAVLTLVGLLLFLRSRKRRQPVWGTLGARLVSGVAEKYGERLQVLFEGEPVPRLTLTVVYFWNAGNEIIDESDLETADPLRIVIDEDNAKIVECHVARQHRPVINAQRPQVDDEGHEALLRFDFLERGDGCAVAVLHTAPSPDAVKLAGTIKASSPLQQLEGKRWLSKKTPARQIAGEVGWFFGFAAVGALFMLAADSLRSLPAGRPWAPVAHYATRVIGGALLSFAVLILFIVGQSVADWLDRGRLPDDLQSKS